MKQAEIEHKENFDLVLYNTLRINSVANDVYFPSSTDEMTLLLANLDNPLIIGCGSNILLSSNGMQRPVIVTKKVNKIKVDPPYFEVEAGAVVSKLSKMALELKLTGFEFLSLLPATLGGAVCMNAGAMGQSISDCFQSALVYDSNEDCTKEFSKEDMQFSYRKSLLKNQERYFLLSAKFKLNEANSFDEIQSKMDENFEKRKTTQANLKDPNLGCTFKNPVIDGETLSAGKLLDEAGMKSKLIGGAMVFYKHANFIINFNNATSLDYLLLMQNMQNAVYEKFNVKLEPEIIYAGDDKKEAEIWKSLIQK